MIINSMTEVHEDLRGDTRPQARKKQPSSIQITLSRYEGYSFFERCANEAVERMEVKGGIRLNTQELSCGKNDVLRY